MPRRARPNTPPARRQPAWKDELDDEDMIAAIRFGADAGGANILRTHDQARARMWGAIADDQHLLASLRLQVMLDARDD